MQLQFWFCNASSQAKISLKKFKKEISYSSHNFLIVFCANFPFQIIIHTFTHKFRKEMVTFLSQFSTFSLFRFNFFLYMPIISEILSPNSSFVIRAMRKLEVFPIRYTAQKTFGKSLTRLFHRKCHQVQKTMRDLFCSSGLKSLRKVLETIFCVEHFPMDFIMGKKFSEV